MLDMLKRHEIQVLRRAGHNAAEVATLAGVSRRSVGRVEAEVAVSHVDTTAEIARRGVGRPSKAEPFRSLGGRAAFGRADVVVVGAAASCQA